MIHSYSGDPTPLSENALNIENAETIKGKMKINQNLTLNDSKIVPIDRIKLVGVTLTSNLRWKETLLI